MSFLFFFFPFFFSFFFAFFGYPAGSPFPFEHVNGRWTDERGLDNMAQHVSTKGLDDRQMQDDA